MLRRRYRYILPAFAVLIGCIPVIARPTPGSSSSFQTAPDVPWANPLNIALNNTGPVTLTGNERRHICTQLTYRLAGDLSKTMHQGCFVPTAFGMVDQDKSVVIFNGTDEAEPIIEGTGGAPIAAIPYSGSVARFGSFSGQGVSMGLYSSFLNALSKRQNITGKRWREVTAYPNVPIARPGGGALAVNPMAMAFSARGQWFVTETPSRALVRVSLSDFSVLPFDRSFFMSGMPYYNHSASMAITENGRYVAVASDKWYSLKIYDLKSCTIASADPMDPQTCQYFDYRPYIESQVTGELQSITHVHFANDNVLTFEVKTSNGTESYALSPSESIASLIPYLAVGDSYASGEGAYNYLGGTDTVVNRCHTSGRSYPLLLSGDKFSSSGRSVACSGARIHDIGSRSKDYTGQASDQRRANQREADGSEIAILHDFKPGYLAQGRFIDTYQPGVITVQIGGNDIGFGNMLLKCLSPIASLKKLQLNPNSCYSTYEDRQEVVQTINRTYGRWVHLLGDLKRRSPVSRVYVIGYPQIFSPVAQCRPNVRLTLKEIGFARDVTVYLNSVIERAAQTAGVHFVDISNALDGRELCNGKPGNLAMHGLTAGTDSLGIIGRESFHPNALGHELIEQAILRATKNFKNNTAIIAQPGSTLLPPSDTEPLLQAPVSGRTINTVVPVVGMASDRAVRGAQTALHITSDAVQLSPNTPHNVQLGGIAVGVIISDSDGNLHGTVTVPVNTDPGIHPITVTDPTPTEQPIVLEDVIYVEHDTNDSDGDTAPNNQDSCPHTENLGVDVDSDGVDDACDEVANTPIPDLPPTDSYPTISSPIPSAPSPQTTIPPTVLRTSATISIARSNNHGSVLGVQHLKRTGKLKTHPPLQASLNTGQKRNTPNGWTGIPLHPQQLTVFAWYLWAGLLAIIGAVAHYSMRRRTKTT